MRTRHNIILLTAISTTVNQKIITLLRRKNVLLRDRNQLHSTGITMMYSVCGYDETKCELECNGHDCTGGKSTGNVHMPLTEVCYLVGTEAVEGG